MQNSKSGFPRSCSPLSDSSCWMPVEALTLLWGAPVLLLVLLLLCPPPPPSPRWHQSLETEKHTWLSSSRVVLLNATPSKQLKLGSLLLVASLVLYVTPLKSLECVLMQYKNYGAACNRAISVQASFHNFFFLQSFPCWFPECSPPWPIRAKRI